jgi:hypothetical protein
MEILHGTRQGDVCALPISRDRRVKIERVYAQHGAYYYVEDLEERNPRTGRPKQKWIKLCRVDAGDDALLEALRLYKRRAAQSSGNIGKAIRDFLADWAVTAKPTPLVRADYERMFGHIGEALVDFNVEQVEPRDVLTFLRRFSNTPVARRAYKARLSTFFSWCVLQGLCAVNPCREIKLKAPPKRKGRLNERVWFAIYDELPPILQCFADLCFLTTARPTEIRLLQESQIADGVIHFLPTKTERSSAATVDWPVTPEIARVLDRARKLNKVAAGPGADAYIIQASSGGRYRTKQLYDQWKPATIRAGHRGVTTRDVRPYALAEAEKAGATLRELQTAAAHTTSATTEGYLDQYRQVVSPVRMTLPRRES